MPNKENVTVAFCELIESEEFKKHPSDIAFAAGKDIAGKVIVADIAKMPHLLIAGATGSGKSVCINTIIMSILYKADPEDVKLIMIDPKVVELSVYNGIPSVHSGCDRPEESIRSTALGSIGNDRPLSEIC